MSKSEPEDSESKDSSESLPRVAGLASSSKPQVYTYGYFAPGEGWYPSPMVPIALQGPGEVLMGYGLADSGADSTALPLAEAAVLGIDLENDCRKEVGGSANGPGEQYVFNGTLAAQVEEVQFRVAATFMDTPVILLGQEDFFRRFHVAFDHREQTVTIRPF